uniref:Potassium channel domain-containing protein n=1 Tax=Lotharella globosa TaxID=91324 RepID=A0A7S3Z6U2_9EUKA
MVSAQVGRSIPQRQDNSLMETYEKDLEAKLPGLNELREELPQMFAAPLIPKCIFIFATCLALSFVYWVISVNCGTKTKQSPPVTKLSATVVLNHVDYAIGTVRLENKEKNSDWDTCQQYFPEISLCYSTIWSQGTCQGSDDEDRGNHVRIEVLTEEEAVVKNANVPLPIFMNTKLPQYYVMRWKRDDRQESLTFRVRFLQDSAEEVAGEVVSNNETKKTTYSHPRSKDTVVLTVVESCIKEYGLDTQDGFQFNSYAPAVAFFLLYMLIGTVFFVKWEGWDEVPAVYFCISTMFTVGYGELAPSDRVSKLFTAILALIGVSFLGITLCTTQIDVTLATVKYQKPRENAKQRMIYGILNWFVVELLNLLFAMAALQELEKFDALDAAYFLVMTSTTEGFGDVAVQTRLGRLAVIFYITVECIALGQLMRIFFTWYVSKRTREMFSVPPKKLRSTCLESPRADQNFASSVNFQNSNSICD